MSTSPPPRILTLLLSGLSSTGKTTLTRLLTHLFPATSPLLILHQDDFYHPDSCIPIVTTSTGPLQDWDCLEAFDFHRMTESIAFIKKHGKAPEGVRSLTAESAVGKECELALVDAGLVEELKDKVRRGLEELKQEVRVLVVEGILMFQEGSEVEGEADLKVLLRAPYKVAKERREGREGYVTIEGFWKDPEGYFDAIVWPNYVKDHKHLFLGEDVEGELNPAVIEKRRIFSPDICKSMGEVLPWTVDLLLNQLKNECK